MEYNEIGAEDEASGYLSDATFGQDQEDEAFSEVSVFEPNRTNVMIFMTVIVIISVVVEAKYGFVRRRVRKK